MSPRRIGITILVLTTISWSTMGIYIRMLAEHLSLFQQVYLRIAVAAFCLLLMGARHIRWHKIQQQSIADWLLLAVRSASMYLLGVGLVSIAYLEGEYSTISLIKALPFAAVLGFLLFKEKATAPKVLFVTLSLAGALMIIYADLAVSIAWSRSELLALISTFSLAFSYSARKWQSTALNNWESSFLMFVLAVLMLITTSWWTGETRIAVENILNPSALFALAMSGLLNALGLFAINYALGHIEIVLSNNIMALQPLCGVLVGVLFYQEVITAWEIAGGGIIIGSLIGMNWAMERPASF